MIKKHLLYSLFAAGYILLYNLVITIAFAKNLSKHNFGILSLFITFVSLGVTISSFNFGAVSQRKFLLIKKKELISHFNTNFLFRVVSYIILSLILFFIVSYRLFILPTCLLLPILIYGILKTTFANITSTFRGMLLIPYQVLVSYIEIIFLGVIFVILQSKFQLSIFSSILILIMATFLTTVIGHLLLCKQKIFIQLNKFSLSICKNYFKLGFPLMGGTLGYLLFTNIDKFFIQYFCGSESVANYVVAMKIGMVVLLPLHLISNIYIQYMSSHSQNNVDKLFSLKFMNILVIFVSYSLLSILWWKDWFILLISTEEYLAAGSIAIYGALFYAMFAVFGFLIQNFIILEKTKYSAYIWGIIILINITADFLFIQRVGAIGAVYASISGIFIGLITLLLVLSKKIGISYWKETIKIILLFGFIVVLGILIPDFLGTKKVINKVYTFCIVLIVLSFMLDFMRFFPKRNFHILLKKEK